MLQDILKRHYRLGTPRFEYDTLPKEKKGGSVFLSRTNHSYGTFFFFFGFDAAAWTVSEGDCGIFFSLDDVVLTSSFGTTYHYMLKTYFKP